MYKLVQIGTVHNSIKDRKHFESMQVISELELYPEYLDGLEGVESFSHLVVLFWFHKISNVERSVLMVHPRRDPALPLTGVFSTRSPARPNPIGISAVELLKKTDNILTVSGLDAIDGTPILDIKPLKLLPGLGKC